MILIGDKVATIDDFDHRMIQNSFERQVLETLLNSSVTHTYRSRGEVVFEMQFRSAITASARELYYSGAQFADFYKSRCNPMFWNLMPDGAFQLRQGVPPAEAIVDIFRNGRIYAFECATAMIIVLYKAALRMLPPVKFNTLFADIRLWGWKYDADLRIVHNIPSQYIPGDIRYVKNPDVNPLTPEWQGENIVDMGDGMYFGHGLGFRTLPGIIDALARRRRPGAMRMPYLLETATRPGFSYLYQFATMRLEQEQNVLLFDDQLENSSLSLDEYNKKQEELLKEYITIRFPQS
ncbi:protein-glutamine gamma-glutamyltransferase [Alkalihalobacillus sp. CinArs1]|uniref:protein-glutamine gamma-glutamyltransferase n=1 Tax=Alkalihalobacillus sp. CinArs1 TaxID=2995314 RepID=UPI0022DD63D0|nr:protein-glutamine gamma-glutamyltransferase [Alkalihalobacillus sp. CinArs1]